VGVSEWGLSTDVFATIIAIDFHAQRARLPLKEMGTENADSSFAEYIASGSDSVVVCASREGINKHTCTQYVTTI